MNRLAILAALVACCTASTDSPAEEDYGEMPQQNYTSPPYCETPPTCFYPHLAGHVGGVLVLPGGLSRIIGSNEALQTFIDDMGRARDCSVNATNITAHCVEDFTFSYNFAIDFLTNYMEDFITASSSECATNSTKMWDVLRASFQCGQKAVNVTEENKDACFGFDEGYWCLRDELKEMCGEDVKELLVSMYNYIFNQYDYYTVLPEPWQQVYHLCGAEHAWKQQQRAERERARVAAEAAGGQAETETEKRSVQGEDGKSGGFH